MNLFICLLIDEWFQFINLFSLLFICPSVIYCQTQNVFIRLFIQLFIHLQMFWSLILIFYLRGCFQLNV